MKRPLVTVGVTAVLLLFFSVPLFFIFYAASRVVDALMILAPVVAIQCLVLKVVQRCVGRASGEERMGPPHEETDTRAKP